MSKAYKDLDEKIWKSCKVWRLTLGSKNDLRNLVNFNGRSGKSENLHFNELLLSIACKVLAKKRIISNDTEKRSKLWRKTDFLFEKWNEEFGEL